ncbi:hypothetical protein ILUMI_10297, partial [Ignelater luminosus]
MDDNDIRNTSEILGNTPKCYDNTWEWEWAELQEIKVVVILSRKDPMYKCPILFWFVAIVISIVTAFAMEQAIPKNSVQRKPVDHNNASKNLGTTNRFNQPGPSQPRPFIRPAQFQPVNKFNYPQPMEVDTNRTKNIKPFQQNFNQRLHYVSRENQENEDENEYHKTPWQEKLEHLQQQKKTNLAYLRIGKHLKFLIDTGSTVSLISSKIYDQFQQFRINKMIKGATIDIPKRKLITKDTTITLEVRNPYRTTIPPGESKIVRIPVSTEDGTAVLLGQKIAEE